MTGATVVRSHGGGGAETRRLVNEIFVARFANPILDRLDDAAVVELAPPAGRLALTTDGYVVDPWEFPGGNIGDLAVCGTVNDLAMAGALPLYLTAGFVLPEGFPLAALERIADAMAARAREAGVTVVAGDTKVVEGGAGPAVTTAGFGVVAEGVEISGRSAEEGDEVLLTGDVGRHGVAVLSRRAGIAFATEVVSDVAPLAGLVQELLAAGVLPHVLRDPTRGGLAGTLNEIARQSQVEIEIDEAAVPVVGAVRSACDLLGLDPLDVANEGCAVVVLPRDVAEAALAILRRHPHGRLACRVGRVSGPTPRVVARTALGGRRLLDAPAGELLPRIC